MLRTEIPASLKSGHDWNGKTLVNFEFPISQRSFSFIRPFPSSSSSCILSSFLSLSLSPSLLFRFNSNSPPINFPARTLYSRYCNRLNKFKLCHKSFHQTCIKVYRFRLIDKNEVRALSTVGGTKRNASVGSWPFLFSLLPFRRSTSGFFVCRNGTHHPLFSLWLMTHLPRRIPELRFRFFRTSVMRAELITRSKDDLGWLSPNVAALRLPSRLERETSLVFRA